MKGITEFLDRLEQVKQIHPNQWMALCPGHHDTSPSLSIKEKDGRILLKCFSGCPVAEILKPLNLETKDLFINGNGHHNTSDRKIVAIYEYTDASGKPFQVVRTDPKGFYQRQPDGNGGYIYNLHGIVPTLYHQNEVMDAISRGEQVFIVEGEKDVETLRAAGITATTNAGGAGNWRDSYTQVFSNADVVVILDQDKPGLDHGHDIARKLLTVAHMVKLLELPKCKDVSEWVSDGGDPESLHNLVSNTKVYTPPPEAPPQANTQFHADGYRFNLTDLGNAERLVDGYGEIIRYSYDRKRWLTWTGKLWEWDPGDRVVKMAKAAVRKIYREAADETDDKRRKELVSHAKRSESESRIKAMMELAQSEPGVPVNIVRLDANPWLLNCQNGTIDLSSGQLRVYRKEDLLTIILPINYSPDAGCPLWLKFLNFVSKDNEKLIDYLQRCVGYSLTGVTREQCLFFLYGSGMNGKSTFVSTIFSLLAGYGLKASISTFMCKDKSGSGPSEGLANLQGKRFVIATETEENQRMAVSLIKDMTGGEPIRADRKYEHEVEFVPTHKLWLSGNHKPVINDSTYSIWRRLKLVPFTNVVSGNEKDAALQDKLLKELEGILAWAVQGCLKWQEQGLDEPGAVTDATSGYREEMDVIGEFISDCCVMDISASVSKTEFYKAYQSWAIKNGLRPESQRYLRSRLLEKDITERKSGSVRYWNGLRLNNEDSSYQSSLLNDEIGTVETQGTVNPEKYIHEKNKENFSDKTVTSVPLSLNHDEIGTDAGTDNDIPPYPNQPCHSCGSKDFWLTSWNEWLCSQCHPETQQ
jgi:putative DNA primase/helicase